MSEDRAAKNTREARNPVDDYTATWNRFIDEISKFQSEVQNNYTQNAKRTLEYFFSAVKAYNGAAENLLPNKAFIQTPNEFAATLLKSVDSNTKLVSALLDITRRGVKDSTDLMAEWQKAGFETYRNWTSLWSNYAGAFSREN